MGLCEGGSSLHETGLVRDLIEEVSLHSARHPGAVVKDVLVHLGKASRYSAESIQQAYEALTAGTPLVDSRLQVAEVDGDRVVLQRIVLEEP